MLSRSRQQVLTFSLGEVEGPALFDGWMARVDSLLDAGDYARAVVVGVSFGGLVAASYAARRPDRVSKLVLVATPSPRWRSTTSQSATHVTLASRCRFSPCVRSVVWHRSCGRRCLAWARGCGSAPGTRSGRFAIRRRLVRWPTSWMNGGERISLRRSAASRRHACHHR